MDSSHDLPHHASHADDERPKLSFWRKLGGGSLSISLIVHGIILAVGIVWVVAIIPAPPEKKVDFMPSGGGGGSPAASEVKNKKRSMSLQSNAPRMAAVGAESKFALPEPDTSSEMTSLGSLGGGGLSAGLGGNGSGGGKGDGHGKGFGSGMGPGIGGGNAPMNPFGMIDPNANALVGVLYDTKKTKDGQATNLSESQFLEIVSGFVSHGWKDKLLEKYYRAPRTLYQTKLFIPKMSAAAAPAAFQCEKEVEPSRWIVVYRGTVMAPKSGKFRFVGAADDLLAVRFNGRIVFDGGFYSAELGRAIWGGPSQVLAGKTENKDLERELRRAYKLPVRFYQYPTSAGYTNMMGGCMVGTEFEVREGSSYPVEILISEIPGGVFGASLMIEETGAKYETSAEGSPVLPLFQLDGAPPAAQPESAYSPAIAPGGPVWKIVSQKGGLDI